MSTTVCICILVNGVQEKTWYDVECDDDENIQINEQKYDLGEVLGAIGREYPDDSYDVLGRDVYNGEEKRSNEDFLFLIKERKVIDVCEVLRNEEDSDE